MKTYVECTEIMRDNVKTIKLRVHIHPSFETIYETTTNTITDANDNILHNYLSTNSIEPEVYYIPYDENKHKSYVDIINELDNMRKSKCKAEYIIISADDSNGSILCERPSTYNVSINKLHHTDKYFEIHLKNGTKCNKHIISHHDYEDNTSVVEYLIVSGILAHRDRLVFDNGDEYEIDTIEECIRVRWHVADKSFISYKNSNKVKGDL